MSPNLKYYVYLNETVQGPHELDYIKSMSLGGDTKVCPEGSTEWTSLDALGNSPVIRQNTINLADYGNEFVPSKIDKYSILNEIGRGGMGSVYLAIDEVLNRKVAIKELKIDEQKKKDPEAYSILIRRFKKEAQVLAQLNHKNIVSVFDIIDQNQNQYIIMEYLNGKNLEELLNIKGMFSIEEAITVVGDTCLALDYIHKKSIIHRDVKPSNIIILEDDTVKLTDFGVTRDLNSATMTQDGSLVGTIAYASPEQDSRDLDGRSDIFSLGVVLYELVTGQKPFSGDTIASVLLKIATKDPVKPSEINPKVHKMLEKIILKAMSKSLGQRYSTALDMFNDLQTYKEALVSNNVAVLSGVKSNDSLYSTGVKVDSIPPGKLHAKDILGLSIPPGKMQAKDLLGQSLPPGRLNTSDLKLPTPAPASINKQSLINTNLNMKNPLYTKPELGLERTQEIKVDNNPLLNQTKKEELVNETVEKETESTKNTANKLKTPGKQQSHVSEQMANERMEAIKEVAIPAGLIIIVLIGLIIGVFNVLDAIILIGTISVANYDYHTAKVSKWVSYILMLMSMSIVFIWLKGLIPASENSKISAMVYYLLDFSLFLISFIGAFFILKGLDYLSIHKNKAIRPFGGIIKSILAFLSIILIVSSTSLIEDPFVQREFEKSKVANIMGSILPEVKIGKRIHISVGKFGLKIGK
jgi:serine/threonine protein kinase